MYLPEKVKIVLPKMFNDIKYHKKQQKEVSQTNAIPSANTHHFLSRFTMHKRGLCRHAVSVCVCLCVRHVHELCQN